MLYIKDLICYICICLQVYGQEVKHTFVECLFGGQLISTVVCEECKYISQILEPFLDLSLPVTEEKPQRPNQGYGRPRKDSERDKEDAGGPGAYHDKPTSPSEPSKHQNKKQKRKQKREARVCIQSSLL